MVATVLAVSLAIAFAPPPPGVASPLGADPGTPRVTRAFTLNVAAGKGLLAIRGADAPQVLGSPTRVTGTVDEETGVLSGVTLSTPPLEFETVALGFPVDVKATFTQVGQGTGLVAATPPPATEGQAQRGTVALRVAAKVTLDLKVRDPGSGAIILEPHCETPAGSPVQLELLSDGPYTQTAGGRIVDTNFSIPTVPTTPQCIGQVAGGVNELLAGSGHSLSLVVQGDLPVPELKPETTTTLTVDPGAGAMRGTPVRLTAAVAPVEANDLDPTGTVLFKEGTRVVGTAELAPDGTATLTTTELRAGDRSLTAEYQGDAEFAPSISPAVAYSITPAPIVTGTFPEYLPRGGAPVEFDLTIDNTRSSRPIANGRVDIAFPTMNINQVVLERRLPDSSWAPVPLPVAFGGIAGTLGPDGGTLVAAGAVVTHRLRISALSGADVRAASVEVELVTVDPGTGVDGPTVATTAWPFHIVRATRTATTTTVGVYDDGGVRPGNTLYVSAIVTPATGVATTGEVEFLIDGKVVPFYPEGLGPLPPLRTRATVTAGSASGRVPLPADMSTGPHLVTARFLGDTSLLPSIPSGLPGEPDGAYVLQVHDPLGPLYTCDFVSVFSDRLGAYVQAYVHLPSWAEAGTELDLQDLEVKVIAGGVVTSDTLSFLHTAGGRGVDRIEIDLGGAGTITGDAVAFEANYDPSIPADQVLELGGLAGTIVVDGEPGDLVALPIERIAMSGVEMTINANFSFTCTPRAEPVVLEEVVVAGVSLTAEPATDPVRVGDEVTLTATAAPAGPFGLVEFFSGSVSLGTASGASGTATLTVDDLPEGPNALSARYSGVPGSPYTSNVVALDVQPAVECAAFAESGHGATVRLVYIELLGRCPDQAGFDYWTGRLAAGTSPEVFARSIARTPEAVGQVVDDAYRTMLGRAPDAAGRAFWVNRMRTGSGRYDQLLADLGASAEFWNLSGATRAGFVTRVYEQLLNRAPDEPGLDYWVARLTPGASRRTLILSLANLDEPLGRLVGLSYDEILGRTPSGTERTDGIAVLRRTGDRSGFYAQLIGRPEFSTRAQGFPNPED